MVSRSHFMHQGHVLAQNVNTRGYLCGGCKTDGNGMSFGCEPCSFHMHDFCSTCPMILKSFLHPEQHPLSLMISNTQYTASPRICDVCEDTVEGLFYWCQICNFNVHPLCTLFPPTLSHAVHYPHRLMFQKSYKDAPCCVCGGLCKSWRYRCGYCDGFDVHAECVAKSYAAKSYETTSRRLPPYAGLYTYGGVSSTANSYDPPCANNQTTPTYNPYGLGVPSTANTYCMYNSHGVVPHGTYAYQPNNPFNMYNNQFNGLPCINTNPYSMHNPHSEEPFDLNSQHSQNQHGNTTSHQAPAHNAHCSPAQGVVKLGSKIFGIVSTLALGVASNLIFGAMF